MRTDKYKIQRREAVGAYEPSRNYGRRGVHWGKWVTVARRVDWLSADGLMTDGVQRGGLYQWRVVFRGKVLSEGGA